MSPTTLDLIVMTLAAAADLVSTKLGLSRGGVEANPLMRNPAVALTLKLGGVVLFVVVLAMLRGHGLGLHADVARWTVAAVWVGAAVWNLVGAYRRKR